MKKRKTGKSSFTLRERFHYWFDKRISKGSLGFIRILIIVSLVFAVLMAGLIILMGYNAEGETASVFWNSIATMLNAWMPYFEEGSPGSWKPDILSSSAFIPASIRSSAS